MDKLALGIVHHFFQIAQCLRFKPHDRPDMGCFYCNLVSQINLIISAQFLNQIVKHMAGMGAMG